MKLGWTKPWSAKVPKRLSAAELVVCGKGLWTKISCPCPSTWPAADPSSFRQVASIYSCVCLQYSQATESTLRARAKATAETICVNNMKRWSVPWAWLAVESVDQMYRRKRRGKNKTTIMRMVCGKTSRTKSSWNLTVANWSCHCFSKLILGAWGSGGSSAFAWKFAQTPHSSSWLDPCPGGFDLTGWKN